MDDDVRDFLTLAAAAGIDVTVDEAGALGFSAPDGMPAELLALGERLSADPALGPQVAYTLGRYGSA